MKTNNPYIEKIEGTAHSVVLIDDWFVGIFHTTMDAWRFISWFGKAVEDRETDLPEKIYIAMVFATPPRQSPSLGRIPEIGKVVKKKLNIFDDGGDPKEALIYTALYEGDEAEALKNTITRLWPDIEEVIYG